MFVSQWAKILPLLGFLGVSFAAVESFPTTPLISAKPACVSPPIDPPPHDLQPPRGGGLGSSRQSTRGLTLANSATPPSLFSKKINNDANDIVQSITTARSSVESCSKAAFFAAATDIVALPFSHTKTMSSIGKFLVVSAVLWKFNWARGLSQSSKIFFQDVSNDVLATKLDYLVDKMYKVMGRLWQQTSILLILSSTTNIVRAFHVKIPWIKYGAAVIILPSIVLVRILSANETKVLVTTNSDINQKSRKMSIYLRNMAVCAFALFIQATTIPFLATTSDKPTPGKIVELLGIISPLVTATLLLRLRHAVLDATKAAFSNDLKSENRLELLEAQQKFYTKVAGTLRQESVIKLLVFIVPIIRTSLTITTA